MGSAWVNRLPVLPPRVANAAVVSDDTVTGRRRICQAASGTIKTENQDLESTCTGRNRLSAESWLGVDNHLNILIEYLAAWLSGLAAILAHLSE